MVALLTASCLAASAQPDRTARILSQAREAIGGERALGAVTGLSITATSRSTVDGVPRPVVSPSRVENASYGNFDVDVELPDKFLVEREWPTAFTRQVSGFNGKQLLEQTRGANGIWLDTPLGEARSDGSARAMRARELVRYLLALLLTVPESYQVRFTDAGDKGGGLARADVLEATGLNNFSARLFFDQQTGRLAMITYSEPPAVGPPASRTAEAAGQVLFKSLEVPKDASDLGDDVRMLVGNYKQDAALLFPHKVRFEVGPLAEEWSVTRVTVNPRFEPSPFSPRSNK